jgi:Flp pilus assembly pilin Flp
MSLSTLPRSRGRRGLTGRSGGAWSGARTRGGASGVSVGPISERWGLRRRFRRLLRDDAGMSTVEYAIGCVAAAGFAALLYSVVTGDSVTTALTQLVQRALTAGF